MLAYYSSAFLQAERFEMKKNKKKREIALFWWGQSIVELVD